MRDRSRSPNGTRDANPSAATFQWPRTPLCRSPDGQCQRAHRQRDVLARRSGALLSAIGVVAPGRRRLQGHELVRGEAVARWANRPNDSSVVESILRPAVAENVKAIVRTAVPACFPSTPHGSSLVGPRVRSDHSLFRGMSLKPAGIRNRRLRSVGGSSLRIRSARSSKYAA